MTDRIARHDRRVWHCRSVKMAAAVSENSSAVLWVREYFDEWTIAWQGRRSRRRLPWSMSDNPAPLVSHDISQKTRSDGARDRGSRRGYWLSSALPRIALPLPRRAIIICARLRIACPSTISRIQILLPSVQMSRTCIPHPINAQSAQTRRSRFDVRSAFWRHSLTAAITCSWWRHWQWRHDLPWNPAYFTVTLFLHLFNILPWCGSYSSWHCWHVTFAKFAILIINLK